MREIVFDTETTGLSPDRGDRMVEIGCVELVNRVETGRTFHAYFNPERLMPGEAEAVHGLSTLFLSDKPRFHEHAPTLLEFLGDSPLVAHNAAFDFAFLNWELGACDHPVVCLSRMVDTVALARVRHPGGKHSLDALCQRFGIDRSHRIKHGALLDAQLLAQVYIELTGGRQIGLMLGAHAREETDAGASGDRIVFKRAARPPRPHAASADELARHAVFVATLADPLWSKLPPGRLVDPAGPRA